MSPRLTAFERVLFKFARPKTVVLTTRNQEYNVMWESLPAGQFRHADHRFVWSRQEFQDWATRVVDQFGYGKNEIVGIIDMSEFVAQQRELVGNGQSGTLLTPFEQVYVPFNSAAASNVCLDEWVSECLTADSEVRADELLHRYSLGERNFEGVCLVDGCALVGADLQGATFENGFFSDVDARRSNLKGATFRNMNLKCTDFRDADLTDAVFDSVLIEGASFRGAIVCNTVFARMTYHGRELNEFQPDDWG